MNNKNQKLSWILPSSCDTDPEKNRLLIYRKSYVFEGHHKLFLVH